MRNLALTVAAAAAGLTIAGSAHAANSLTTIYEARMEPPSKAPNTLTAQQTENAACLAGTAPLGGLVNTACISRVKIIHSASTGLVSALTFTAATVRSLPKNTAGVADPALFAPSTSPSSCQDAGAGIWLCNVTDAVYGGSVATPAFCTVDTVNKNRLGDNGDPLWGLACDLAKPITMTVQTSTGAALRPAQTQSLSTADCQIDPLNQAPRFDTASKGVVNACSFAWPRTTPTGTAAQNNPLSKLVAGYRLVVKQGTTTHTYKYSTPLVP